MEKIKSLADQLREKMVKPVDKTSDGKPRVENEDTKKPEKKVNKAFKATILQVLTDYDNSNHKTMVHFRFDKKIVNFLNQFKIATGVDATKFVAFSVRHFIDAHPELKTIIKQFIQNDDL